MNSIKIMPPPAPANHSTTEHQPAIEDRIQAAVAHILDLSPGEIDRDIPLSHYGLDSVDSVELETAFEAEFGRALPDELWIGQSTIRSLAKILARSNRAIFQIPRTPAGAPILRMRHDAVLPEDIFVQKATPSAPDTVLLTGATGFLGSAVLASLLTASRCKIIAVIRAREQNQARDRLRAAMDQYRLGQPDLSGRVEILLADLAQPKLARSRNDLESLAQRIDAICHCAASVNWVEPYARLHPVNVAATADLLQLACCGQPKRFVFISSLAVCYSSCGPKRLAETDPVTPYWSGLDLGYAQTKAVAEELVLQAGYQGLPVTIIRPALLSGHTCSGASNLDDLLSRLIKGCIEMGTAPDLDWLIDSCPVDFAAKTVTRVLHAKNPPRLLHLATPAKTHWRQCVLWMNLAGYPVRLVAYPQWVDQVRRFDPLSAHALRTLRSLFLHKPPKLGGFYLPELFEETRRTQACSLFSQAELAALGLRCPSLDPQLLKRYFAFFVSTGFLSKAYSAPTRCGATGQPRFDASFFEPLLRRYYGDPGIKVRRTTEICLPRGSSIIAEISSIASNRIYGLFAYHLQLKSGQPGVPHSSEVVVKVKPEDREIIDLGERLAGICSDSLGRAYGKFKHLLGFNRCHYRELALYEQKDPRFRRHAPECIGTLCHDSSRQWILVLERLRHPVLLDSVDDVAPWGPEHLESAVRGLAQLHAIWYRKETELQQQSWLGEPCHASGMVEMSELWLALGQFGANLFGEWAGPDFLRHREKLIARLADWWPILEQQPRTLIHNDCNPRNIAFRPIAGGLRLCLYDWELATLQVPQHDLAELLCFVLKQGFTREELSHYLELHRQCLECATGDSINPDTWFEGFRCSLWDLMINRLPLYLIAHKFQPQSFLPRVFQSCRRLHEWLAEWG